jgi:hypothetical protein
MRSLSFADSGPPRISPAATGITRSPLSNAP